jgi:hypothetical protein
VTNISANSMLGTKWLKFWVYGGLPAVGVVAFLMFFHLPRLRYEILPIAMLCFAVAVGLHQRKLWGWRWNWLVLAIVYLALLVPLQIRETRGDFANFVTQGVVEFISKHWTRDSIGDLIVPLAIRLVLVGLFWLFPNWLYWKKRQMLFS